MTLLEVSNLRIRLQTHRGPADAVRGVSFSLARGETASYIRAALSRAPATTAAPPASPSASSAPASSTGSASPVVLGAITRPAAMMGVGTASTAIPQPLRNAPNAASAGPLWANRPA